MKRLHDWFIASLEFIAALASRVVEPIRKVKQRLDPFENVELFFSPWRKWIHEHAQPLFIGLALVATLALPGSAMPTWATHGAIRFWSLAPAGVATMIGATNQPPPLKPFRFGTVRRRANIGSFAWVPGTQLPAVVIPQVGMLSRVLFNATATYTVATAPLVLVNLDGFDALFARAQITLNNGSAQIVDLSGIGVNQVNKNINTALPIKKGTPLGAGNVNGTQFPLALGASTLTYRGFLPVNANQRRQFEMGLVNLQAPELRANINLVFNSSAFLVTTPANLTAFVGAINLSYEYYEIPDPTQYAQPPLVIVRSIEEAPIAITATGLQTYQLPRLGTMIEYHAVVILNLFYAVTTVAVSNYAVKYNKTDQQYDVFMGDWETYEAELYGIGIDVAQAPTPTAATPTSRWQCNTGAVTFNLWAAGDTNINGGDFRDAIDTEENTTTESIVTIATGTALNAGKDSIVHVRRVVQRIVPVQRPNASNMGVAA